MKLSFFTDYSKITPPVFSAAERRAFAHHVRDTAASPVTHDTMRATWVKGSPKFRTAKRRTDVSGKRIPNVVLTQELIDPFVEARTARLARNAARIAAKASDLRPNWADKRATAATPLSLDDL